MTCTAANSLLKKVKLQEEAFKSKRFLRLQQVSNLGIGDSLTLISSYMVYCLMTPKMQLPSEGKLLGSIIMRSCKYCIADRTMESYSDACHTKRYRRHSKKLMMVYVELTNPDPNSETGSEDLAIIIQRWSLTPSSMLSDVMHVRSTVALSIKHQDIFIQYPLHGWSEFGVLLVFRERV